MRRRPPRSPLFPYPTLSRSKTRCWREASFETRRCACRNREIQQRTRVPRTVARPAVFARRTRFHRFVVWSFARRGGFADDLIIPAGVVALGKSEGNIAANDRTNRSALPKHAHVDVDQKQATGDQRLRGVTDN